jgi:toxin ParE1/3/4
MPTLVVTAHANRDFDDILNHLGDVAGQRTAQAYAERFADALERIEQFRGAGPQRLALGPNTRIAIVLPYVLIYDYSEIHDHLVLLRVLHGRRKMTERLLKR